MDKMFFKVCSVFLVIVMLVNMLPMSVFAEEFQQSLSDAAQSVEPTPVTVVDEIVENRTEFSKEFLLSNGLHLATVYPDAVHYKTENGWEEIDNTLVTHADGSLTNTAGVWDVSFPGQLSENDSVTIEKDGYTLSFSMAGELNSTGAALMTAESDAAPMQMLGVEEAQVSEAQVQEIDLTEAREAAEHPETVPDKLLSRLTYDQVYEDTDIIYDLDSNKVKESVILEAYSDTLQGYQYTLEVGEMVPVLEEDGQIVFYDKTRQNVIMVMPAPYLLDDAGVYNDDIQVHLEGSGSSYTMTYLLPTEWLAAEDRAWPVVLDPIVNADLEINNILDRTVTENVTYSQTWGMNSCGYDTDTGIQRFYLMYRDLPCLTSSDVIVNASIQMIKPNSSSTVTTVEVHKVESTWDPSTITWSNKPAYDTNIEDYSIVDDVNWYGWVVTDIVRDWYAGENTGMMFKASDSIESSGSANFKQFWSSDYGTSESRPVLAIQFRNNNGLESYWDYTGSSAGRAGTGYVNNYTGNMVWTRTDMGFGGNRMPVTISHIYNLNDAIIPSDSNNSNDSGGNAFGMGSGWRTNFNQLIYKWSVDSSYYVWEDSDGTDHYFKQEDGVYKDEDGLELTLTDTGSGTQKYCITDKDGNCSYFDTEGRLTAMTNNQATKSSIIVTYGSGKQISSITDGVGRVYAFTYTDDLLSRISYQGTGTTELSYVTFGYSNNKLTTVTDKDGESSNYGYNSAGLLNTVQDVDGYKLTYGYNTVSEAWQPYRVLSVAESDGTAAGGTLSFAYGHNQTTITDHNGNQNILQFNDFGNLTCIQDDEGKAQFAQYAFDTDSEKEDNTDGTAKGNQLRVGSKLQNTVGNRLKNNSFESGNLWTTNSTAITASRSTDAVYVGRNSQKLVSTTNSTVAAYGEAFYVEPGETYTFSAYVKTEGARAVMAMQCTTNYYTPTGDSCQPNQDWTRVRASYSNTGSVADRVIPVLFLTAAGTAYIDGVQVEKTDTPSRYNLADNGDFRHPEAPAVAWSPLNLTAEDTLITVSTPAAPTLDNSVMKITGNPTGYKQLMNYIPISGDVGDTYVVSGWAKGNSVAIYDSESNNRAFCVSVVLNNHDGSFTSANAEFNPDTDQWQYSADVVVADKSYHSITVIVRYNFNANTVYFDGIQLYKEEFGNSYTYDDKGNVISVKDLQAQTTNYEYDTGSNLTKVIQNNKAKMTYTYDSYHNVKTATTEEGLAYSFAYDTYGNNTSVSISSGGKTMSSSAAYSTDGNRLEKTTDALGKETTYSYNAQTNVLEWVQYPEDTEATRIEYTYDSMYRVASAACETDTNLELSAAYTYSDDRLTAITTPTTTYSMTYGDFGLRTGVSIGSRNLATYHYTDDRNNYLSSLDYGNGDKVQYTYDDKGRTIGQTYEDGDTVSYTYDNSGALATVTDSVTGITTTYYYDLTDRLMKYVEKGTGYNHSVAYEYDTLNNLKKLTETVNGVVHTTTYDYDDDNRVTASTTDGITVTYTYDGFGRVETQTTKNGSTTILTESYTYTAPTAGTTSAQIATYTTATPNGYSVTYSYTYDDNGNITGATGVTDGTYTDSYVYDSANQLIREDNQALGYSYAWDYDNAGNITQRRGYDYTDGALDDPIEFADYTYGNSDWGDLLTSYGGKNLTYDEIGNPLTDGTWTYTWEHGRQLASMSKGNTTWNYTYNADGLRTKRTDGTNTYTYIYNGSKLMQLKKGSDTLDFTYDAGGTPLTVTYNGTVYYYVTNLQGDVTSILDASGTEVVKYIYDAWGTTWLYSGTMSSTLGALNPLRYRGYVYDTETKLYYVSSRYYDSKIGRWINADGAYDTNQGVLGYNMYAYCLNNPVNMYDPDGRCSRFLGFLWKIDCKQASCPDSKNYVKPKAVDPIGSYNKGQGYVYIVKEDLLDEIMEDKEDNVVVILDNRTASDPNMQIQDSYRITKTKQQKEIAQLMLDYNTSNPVEPAWSRTLDSLVEEWKLHNFAHSWWIKRERTADCDFNNADEGMGFWDFVGR